MSGMVKDLDVITTGEAMVLFAAQQTGPLENVSMFARTSAGAELNVAIGLARLGLQVGYLSRLGNDAFGRFLLSTLQGEGIDSRQVAIDAQRRTGFMLKSRSDNGSDPQIEYNRKNSAASYMSATEIDPVYCARARHLHLTGIYVGVSASTCDMIFELARLSRQAGLSISFDPNLRPALWPSQSEMVACLNRLSLLSDWVLPGLAEGRLLTGCDTAPGIADFYLARGARHVVVKLGAEGAYYASADERGWVPGIAVPRIVDTVGAGDGFAVGIISGLLEGLSLQEATDRANQIGARVLQFPGDSDGLPTRAELQAQTI
jgi:2-dehydro-3-deoxygluconokinase